jgi:hypothetical protein
MSRYIPVRAGLVALVTAFALGPASALGDQPVSRFHRHGTQSFSTELCGIQVDYTQVNTVNDFQYADGSSRRTASVRITFTNPETGQSVIISNAGQRSGSEIIDEEAGTMTFVTSFAGVSDKIQTANGPVLVRNAGLISLVTTIDLNTFEVLSDEIIIKGPHPFQSDSALYCAVITEALK